MSRAGARSGWPIRAASIPPAWCSSTRPGPRPTWRRCADGRPAASACQAKVPYGHWKTMTFLAALRHDRVTAPWLIDGPINGQSFLTYVEQVLAPTLQPGDIVVMDNLGIAQGQGRTPRHPSGRRQALLPAQILARSQPDRDSSSPSSSTGCERPPDGPSTPSTTPSPRSCHRRLTCRMLKLLRKLRL